MICKSRPHLIVFYTFLAIIAAVSGFAKASNGEQTLEISVVMIRSVHQNIDYTLPWKQMGMNQGVGSGFVIAGNRILTNAHNVSNYKYIEIIIILRVIKHWFS